MLRAVILLAVNSNAELSNDCISGRVVLTHMSPLMTYDYSLSNIAHDTVV